MFQHEVDEIPRGTNLGITDDEFSELMDFVWNTNLIYEDGQMRNEMRRLVKEFRIGFPKASHKRCCGCKITHYGKDRSVVPKPKNPKPNDDEADAKIKQFMKKCYDERCDLRAANIECNANCGKSCRNRPFSGRQIISPTFQIVPRDGKGKCLITTTFIHVNSWACEYHGHLVYSRNVDEDDDNLFIIKMDGTPYSIDARNTGSFARFVSHSCEPNLEYYAYVTSSEFRVVLMAKRNIFPGEELTANYGDKFHITNCECQACRYHTYTEMEKQDCVHDYRSTAPYATVTRSRRTHPSRLPQGRVAVIPRVSTGDRPGTSGVQMQLPSLSTPPTQHIGGLYLNTTGFVILSDNEQRTSIMTRGMRLSDAIAEEEQQQCVAQLPTAPHQSPRSVQSTDSPAHLIRSTASPGHSSNGSFVSPGSPISILLPTSISPRTPDRDDASSNPASVNSHTTPEFVSIPVNLIIPKKVPISRIPERTSARLAARRLAACPPSDSRGSAKKRNRSPNEDTIATTNTVKKIRSDPQLLSSPNTRSQKGAHSHTARPRSAKQPPPSRDPPRRAVRTVRDLPDFESYGSDPAQGSSSNRHPVPPPPPSGTKQQRQQPQVTPFPSAIQKKKRGGQRIYPEGMIFRCPEEGCDHTAYKKSHLDSHIETHSEEYPFRCDMCDHKTKTEKCLKVHKKLKHSNARPFVCSNPGCDRSYKLQHKLNGHLAKCQFDPAFTGKLRRYPPLPQGGGHVDPRIRQDEESDVSTDDETEEEKADNNNVSSDSS